MRLEKNSVRSLKWAIVLGLAVGTTSGMACEDDLANMREQLDAASLPADVVRDYTVLLEAAATLHNTGDSQSCVEIVTEARSMLQTRQEIMGQTGAPGSMSAANEQDLAEASKAAQDQLRNAQPLSGLARLDLLADMTVLSPNNEDLGNIVDLVVDLGSGEVDYALMSLGGGILSLEREKLYPIPLTAFRVARDPELVMREVLGSRSSQPIGSAENLSIATQPQEPIEQPQASSEQDRGAQGASGTGGSSAAQPAVSTLQGSVLVLDVDRQTLEQAPGLEDDVLMDVNDPEWSERIVAFYADLMPQGGADSGITPGGETSTDR